MLESNTKLYSSNTSSPCSRLSKLEIISPIDESILCILLFNSLTEESILLIDVSKFDTDESILLTDESILLSDVVIRPIDESIYAFYAFPLSCCIFRNY